jgi:hypothetical protein
MLIFLVLTLMISSYCKVGSYIKADLSENNMYLDRAIRAAKTEILTSHQNAHLIPISGI